MACNAFYNLYQLHSILNKHFIFTLSSVIKPEKIIYSIFVKMTLDSENPIPNQKNKRGSPLLRVNFLPRVNIVKKFGIVEKFQNLKNIYQIIAKVLQQMS